MRNGYAVARVDIRGTDRVVSDWLAKQPFSSGRAGMFGISWGGFNSIQMAMRRSPALWDIVPVMATDDIYREDVHFMDGIMHVDVWEIGQDLWNVVPGAPEDVVDDAYSAGTDWPRTELAPIALALGAIRLSELTLDRPGRHPGLPRPLARPEHEGGVRRGLTGEQGVVVQHAQVAIEAFADFDPTAGIGAPAGAAGDLHPARPEVHGVVAGVALELLGERPVGIVAREDVEAVPVQFQRQAILPAGVVEDRDVAMQILLGPRKHKASGVEVASSISPCSVAPGPRSSNQAYGQASSWASWPTRPAALPCCSSRRSPWGDPSIEQLGRTILFSSGKVWPAA